MSEHKALRESLGISRENAAEIAGVKTSVILRVESGTTGKTVRSRNNEDRYREWLAGYANRAAQGVGGPGVPPGLQPPAGRDIIETGVIPGTYFRVSTEPGTYRFRACYRTASGAVVVDGYGGVKGRAEMRSFPADVVELRALRDVE